jgi:two-component system cell cycle response regulator
MPFELPERFPLDERDMTSVPPPTAHRVLLLGFGEFERQALSSYLRLSGSREPAYEQVDLLEQADFVIADADHPGAIDAVLAAHRAADTVFIGSLAPEQALAWAMRPIDPLQLFRELDAAVALRRGGRPDRDAPPTTSPGHLDAPMRRAGDVNPPTAALVVDDSEIALRYLQRQLNALGLRTETATDSKQALQLLSQQRYDVVFLDVDLGPQSEMDGLTLCQHLKAQPRPPGTGLAPKVVIVSAHASPTDRVRGTFAGCDAYLAKPLDDEVLRRQLRQFGLLADLPSKRSLRRHRNGTDAPLGR